MTPTSSSVASCSTFCRKGSAASGTSVSWRTPAGLPNFQLSALLCTHRSLPRPSNTPIIASTTQSSPAIALIYAPSAEAAWSRSAFGRARHHGDALRRAVIPHDETPRTTPFAHHCAHLHADASRRNVEPFPQELASALAMFICCQKHAIALAPAITRTCSSPQFLLMAQLYGANNPLPNRRRLARMPIGLDQTTRGFAQSGFK